MCRAEQPALRSPPDRTDKTDIAAEVRTDLGLEIAPMRLVSEHRTGNHQRITGALGRFDGEVDAFFGTDPAEEQHKAAL